MLFGPMDEEQLCHLEEIPQYKQMGEGVKMAEFAYSKSKVQRLVVLEAKTSFANPCSGNSQDFSTDIGDVVDKFTNAFDLLGRMALCKDLPSGFHKIDYRQIEYRFILVIKGHEKDWLHPVKDALEQKLSHVARVARLCQFSVCVLNEEMAARWGMLSTPGQAGGQSFWL